MRRLTHIQWAWPTALLLGVVIGLRPSVAEGAELASDVTQVEVATDMEPGKDYRVTVTVKNTGTRTWKRGEQYSLVVENTDSPDDAPDADDFAFEEELKEDVAPGEGVKLSGTVRSPDWTGEWELSAWMAYRDTPFGEVYAVDVEVASDQDARVERVGLKSQLSAGQLYRVDVKVRNSGRAAWNEGPFVLVSRVKKADADDTRAKHEGLEVEVEIPKNVVVAPGATYTFSDVPLTAPTTTGTYTVEWRMRQKAPFGRPLLQKLDIEVPRDRRKLDLDAEIVRIGVEEDMQAGKSYRVTVSVKNTGTYMWPAVERDDYVLVCRPIRGPSGVVVSQRDELQFEERIGGDVGRGDTTRIVGSVEAPIWAGDWTLLVYMTHNGKPFGEQVQQKLEVLHELDARIDSVRLKTPLAVGGKYELRVKVRNTGRVLWYRGTDIKLTARVLRTKQGDKQAGENAFEFVEILPPRTAVAPGKTYEFSRRIEAPASAGTWLVAFQVYSGLVSKLFGEEEEIEIEVR